MSRFDYVKYDATAIDKQEILKSAAIAFEKAIEECLPFTKDTIAAKTKAINHLEISYMWCGKAVRDEQISRNTSVEIQRD